MENSNGQSSEAGGGAPAAGDTDLRSLPPAEAAKRIEGMGDADACRALGEVIPTQARRILAELPPRRSQDIMAEASVESRRQWAMGGEFPSDTVGHWMEAPIGVFHPGDTVGDAVAQLRGMVRKAFITYAFVVDDAEKLLGVITMRDLLFNDTGQRLSEVMLREPFSLQPGMTLLDAMKSVLNRHYPVYPVCDAEGRLLGLIRGQTLFEEQAIELSAQAGSMVGVEKEERLSTPLVGSLKFRHPWLQLNLLTAFVAAAVVGVFQDTIDRIVVLAVFLPVLAGQSGNTGCQALAVALRGMTLGELKPGRERALVFKEATLGLLNGALVGLTAGAGMFIVAMLQGNPAPLTLSVVVFIAMIGSCVISGVSGVVVPLLLRKFGADPATASSIFLTTATDVASMGIFLGLATLLV